MIKKTIITILSLLSIISCSEKLNSQNINDKGKNMNNNTAMPENVKYAYFSSGCFWGTEYWFEKSKGVLSVVSGYAGGHKVNPTYQEVCTGLTGHLETVRVAYDPEKTTYEELVKLFFETHDFTQKNGQGPDIGSQYLSAIFYQNDEEKEIAEKYVAMLREKKYDVATTIRPFKNFYEAEDYHQDYYAKKGSMPYCHFYTKIF
ncbi:peptide-methionine (S)-S-oxide reductase MsrA [Brachyspira hampsonii]|uniref:Peptide methionine sulfoxide reductase MsrA n=1 Tax=Brachyspira hampsonii TaxID=1287055 RepID=A0AAC9TRT0_9SPIR|nr:peptide-methionine (S)-S-oxide reductase MsrA [Brachyspira hampsonii]ASJ20785.1 peptide-methionine (S)-S-oxide reductase [Brachyspira hampsonii]ELV06801.1 bifunctional methionine sulfoxide reductase [Brachyspira hampsonii 30599]MBW5379147.1 peptide-methionine (S)-S-oxide reductase [Brachyspira hampsonii]MBW5411015.1 peptide-methionine (S)-S-oxide reductase [Brachyspira hampsonii]OEJ14313.1 peptide-methionine (S)-S-oxide reductase [Brachyspira hampsonii]